MNRPFCFLLLLINASPVMAGNLLGVVDWGASFEINSSWGGEAIYENKTEKLRAGTSPFGFGLGTNFNVNTDGNNGISFLATITTHHDYISLSDPYYNEAAFVSFPLDILLFRYSDEWSIGGGISYHMLPGVLLKHYSSILGESRDTIDYKNALGYTAAVGAGGGINNPFWIQLRFTLLTFEPEDAGRPNVNGNSISVHAGFNLN